MGTKNIWKMTAWKYSELENFYLFIEVWGKKIQVILSLYYVLMCALPGDIFQSLYYLKHFLLDLIRI